MEIMSIIEKEEKIAGTQEISARVFKKNPAKLFYKNLGYKKIKQDVSSLTLTKIL